MANQINLNPRRILLIDDEPDVRAAIGFVLRFDKHTVVEAGSGREALELFQPGKFDLVITDYLMPEIRGDKLAAIIKRLDPAQPILMVSGSAVLLDASTLQADALLAKPFSLAELRQFIAQLQ
jgi:CheY-like chemotaxis protein